MKQEEKVRYLTKQNELNKYYNQSLRERVKQKRYVKLVLNKKPIDLIRSIKK